MQPIGVGHNAGTRLPGQETGVPKAPQVRSQPLSVKAFRSNVLQTALAHILNREHGSQERHGAAWQTRLWVGAVVGGNGRGNLISATLVNGQ
jgi:hypothetical protein